MINIFLLIAFGRLVHRSVVYGRSRASSEKITVFYVLFWVLPLFIYTWLNTKKVTFLKQ